LALHPSLPPNTAAGNSIPKRRARPPALT